MLKPGLTGEAIRVLIIGAGKMGQAHTAAFASLPGVEIVAVASRGGESAARLAAAHGVSRWGNDWHALADELTPHACVVAVSHLFNESVTAEAVERGLHVLSEKPVALHSTAIRKLAAQAEEQGVIAMAAMNRRFFPSVSAAIDMARFYGGVLGVTVVAPDPVRPYRAQYRYDPAVYDRWMQTNTLHAIDLLRLAGGDVEWMAGQARFDEMVGERSVVATIRFCSGVLGCFISYGGIRSTWELRIHGDGIEVHLEPLERGTIRIGDGPPQPLPTSIDPAGLKPGLRMQALAFVESVRDVGRLAPPASDFNDHARTMELAEALEQLSAPLQPSSGTGGEKEE